MFLNVASKTVEEKIRRENRYLCYSAHNHMQRLKYWSYSNMQIWDACDLFL